MKTLLVPMSPRLMARSFLLFLTREFAVIATGFGAVWMIPDAKHNLVWIGVIGFVAAGSAVLIALSQRYTYLLSDRGIFLTTLGRDPRRFRRTLALWSRHAVTEFDFREESDEFCVSVLVDCGRRRRRVFLRMALEDAAKVRKELAPMLGSLRARHAGISDEDVRAG